MKWINYNHLYYFWIVAREGSIAEASKILHLSQPTISTQIQKLEKMAGNPLFKRVGRRMELTEEGRQTYEYAQEIFGLGKELLSFWEGRPKEKGVLLRIGISDGMPKQMAYELIKPALSEEIGCRIVCTENKPDQLIEELVDGTLDFVLTDSPLPSSVKIKAFNHRLGESGIAFLAEEQLALRLRDNFPNSLDGAPALLPATNQSLRRNLEQWFEDREIKVNVVGEFQDSALAKSFATTGAGFICIPAVRMDAIMDQYRLAFVGKTDEVRETFYGISLERKVKNPAVQLICETAKKAGWKVQGS